MLGGRRGDDPAVGRDDARRYEVVAAEAGEFGEPADPAAQRQAGDSRVADLAAGHRLRVYLRGRVEIGPRRTGTTAHAVRAGVDSDVAHAAEVDHQAVVTGAVPREAVPAAAHRDLEVVFTSEADRGGDIVGRRRERDHGRTAVDVAVPETAPLVVAGISGKHQLPAESRTERIERTAGDRDHRVLLDRGP